MSETEEKQARYAQQRAEYTAAWHAADAKRRAERGEPDPEPREAD